MREAQGVIVTPLVWVVTPPIVGPSTLSTIRVSLNSHNIGQLSFGVADVVAKDWAQSHFPNNKRGID